MFIVQYVRHDFDGIWHADTPVLSIDFAQEDKAREFFNLVKEGNEFGEGHILKLFYNTPEEANILDEHEF